MRRWVGAVGSQCMRCSCALRGTRTVANLAWNPMYEYEWAVWQEGLISATRDVDSLRRDLT